MLILIDGYNVIAPVAAPGRRPTGTLGTSDWLRVQRQRLIDLLVRHLDESLRSQTTVVFDAAGANAKALARLGLESITVDRGIQIEFSVEYDEADDRLEELILQHSSPKRLTVVSSDHRIQAAAKRRGATAIDSEVWLQRLTEGKYKTVTRGTENTVPPASDREIEDDQHGITDPAQIKQWLDEFGFETGDPTKTDEIDNPFPKGYAEDLDELPP